MVLLALTNSGLAATISSSRVQLQTMYQQVLRELKARKRNEFIVRYCASLFTTLTIVVMYASVVVNLRG